MTINNRGNEIPSEVAGIYREDIDQESLTGLWRADHLTKKLNSKEDV